MKSILKKTFKWKICAKFWSSLLSKVWINKERVIRSNIETTRMISNYHIFMCRVRNLSFYAPSTLVSLNKDLCLDHTCNNCSSRYVTLSQVMIGSRQKIHYLSNVCNMFPSGQTHTWLVFGFLVGFAFFDCVPNVSLIGYFLPGWLAAFFRYIGFVLVIVLLVCKWIDLCWSISAWIDMQL